MRILPDRLPDERISDAEHDLISAFRNELGNDYTVFCGVRWTAHGRGGGAIDGEADLVIVHPSQGVLVVEVKGGQIEIDGPTGTWFSTDRFGKRHEIRNPFEQAQRNMYALADKVKEAQETSGFAYAFAHAVAFPDVRVGYLSLGPGVSKRAIIDTDAYGNMPETIERIFSHALGNQRHDIGSRGVSALERILVPSRTVPIALTSQLRAEQERFRTLTEDQYDILDMLAGHRRALIDGCAGSGKTFLAVEKARRLASEGFETLLTCFNRALPRWIRASHSALPDNLRIQHFHELAMELANSIPPEVRVPEDRTAFFKSELPSILLERLPEITTRFDAIVVDEGQDFEDLWWIPLMSLLRDENSGICYVFYDSQQAIYTGKAQLPFDSDPHYLTRNLRNTQAIHRLVAPFYGGRTLACRGPEGREPKFVHTTSPEDALRKELHRLVQEEHIPTEDIIVLTPSREGRSRWSTGQQLGNLRLVWSHEPGHREIAVSTIHSFKGLERPVVIVTELSQGSAHTRDELLRLVAFSRASSELIVIESA